MEYEELANKFKEVSKELLKLAKKAAAKKKKIKVEANNNGPDKTVSQEVVSDQQVIAEAGGVES